MKYKKNIIIFLSCLFFHGLSLSALGNPAPRYTSVQGTSGNSAQMRYGTQQLSFTPSKVQGLSGFSKAKFSYKRKAPRQDAHIAKQIEKAKLPSKKKQKRLLDDEKLVVFSGKSQEQMHNSAITTKGKLSGTKDVLDKEENESTQFDMKYKNTQDTSTRLSVNSQDQSSPLYSPLKKEEGLNAAGVYVETALSESTKALIGGEIRNPEALNNDSDNSTSQGVAVGLSWSF